MHIRCHSYTPFRLSVPPQHVPGPPVARHQATIEINHSSQQLLMTTSHQLPTLPSLHHSTACAIVGRFVGSQLIIDCRYDAVPAGYPRPHNASSDTIRKLAASYDTICNHATQQQPTTQSIANPARRAGNHLQSPDTPSHLGHTRVARRRVVWQCLGVLRDDGIDTQRGIEHGLFVVVDDKWW